MSSKPIEPNKGSSSNTGKITSGGQTSNDYVKKLVEDKLTEYELKLQSMRTNEEVSDEGEGEGKSIKNKSAEEFINLKIQQLRELYVKMNKELLNDPNDIT